MVPSGDSIADAAIDTTRLRSSAATSSVPKNCFAQLMHPMPSAPPRPELWLNLKQKFPEGCSRGRSSIPQRWWQGMGPVWGLSHRGIEDLPRWSAPNARLPACALLLRRTIPARGCALIRCSRDAELRRFENRDACRTVVGVFDVLHGDWWTPSATIAASVLAAPFAVAMLLRPSDDEVAASVCARLRANDWRSALEASQRSPVLAPVLRAIDEQCLDEVTLDRGYRSPSKLLDDPRARSLVRARLDEAVAASHGARSVQRGAAAAALLLYVLLVALSTSSSWSWLVTVAGGTGAVVVAHAIGIERYSRAQLRARRESLDDLLVPFATGARTTSAS